MTEVQWFYMLGSQSRGPVTEAQLVELLSKDDITRETLVWRNDEQGWKPISEQLPVFSTLPPPLPLQDPKRPSIPSPALIGAADSSLRLDRDRRAPRTSPSTWSDGSAHPWRRYFARMLDELVHGTLAILVVSIALYAVDPAVQSAFAASMGSHGSGFRLLGGLAVILGAIPVNALFIGFTGGSLGKWLFGVRVLGADARPVGYWLALKREILVWVRGLGLGIPIVSLFTLASALTRLERYGSTSWDADLSTALFQRPQGLVQRALSIFGFVLFLLLCGALSGMSAS